MNIYDLLRMLVRTTAQHGGMSKLDVFNGIDLINRLQEASAFGTYSGIVSGNHPFTSLFDNGERKTCFICGKDRYEHE